MTSSGGWRSLDLPDSGAPKLLLKPQITSTGYHVQLTDLCRVWAENLNERDLIRRAWDEGCSIDPSEDDKQFSIFLEKLEGALNGEDGTTMELIPGDGDGLQIKLSAQLPRGFQTLVWTVCFARQPEGILAETLTVPLLRQASGLQTQIQQLIHELQEKDRIISKITDRLETSGNDLTTVFPGVSNIRTNKKKSQREQLARHVRGLADFDEAEWRSKPVRGTDWWKDFDRVLRGLPEPDATEHLETIKHGWWHGLTTRSKSKSKSKSESGDAATASPIAATTSKGIPVPREESVLDDEFQRQATPDHLKRGTPMRSDDTEMDDAPVHTEARINREPEHVDDGDSTTEDEDDLDAAPKRKPTPKSPKPDPTPWAKSPTAGPPKKLGALGGRSSKPSSSPARQPTPEEQPQPSKPRAKLGAIGGKAKVPQKCASPTPEVQAVSAFSAPRKMGVIGGKREPSESAPHSAVSSRASISPEPGKDRSRATTKEPTPPPRETSQERADMKRNQLKKELEQKAKAPARKKRKF